MLRCVLCWWSQSRRCFYLCPDNHKQDQSGSRCDIAGDTGRGSVLVCDVLTCSLLSICCFQLSAIAHYLLSANSAGKKTPLLSYVQSNCQSGSKHILFGKILKIRWKLARIKLWALGKGKTCVRKSTWLQSCANFSPDESGVITRWQQTHAQTQTRTRL